MSDTVSSDLNASEYEEHIDDDETLSRKVRELGKLMKKHRGKIVVFTGAGISTSAGIPDFRSGTNSATGMPAGKWCKDATSGKWDSKMRQENRARTRKTKSALQAIPTRSHMALVALRRAGYLSGLISQNCDGLHRRSGFDTRTLAELHGNTNLEVCGWCGREYFRDFSAYHGRHTAGRVLRRTMWPVHKKLDLINPRKGNHYTGRRCVAKGCDGYLFDSTIDFGDNLPEKHINRGYRLAKQASLCIVLGSRCSVSPACDMPISVGERGDDLVVVNLQQTAADRVATLRVGAKIDDVMVPLMKMLDIEIPKFELVRRVHIVRRPNNEVVVSSFDMADEDEDEDDFAAGKTSTRRKILQNDIVWNVQAKVDSGGGDVRKGSLLVELNQDAAVLPSREREANVPLPGDRAVVLTLPWQNEAYPGKADVMMTTGKHEGQVFAVSSNLLDVCGGTRTSKEDDVVFVNSGSSEMSHRVSLPSSSSSHVTLMFRANYGEPPVTLAVPEKQRTVELRFDPMGSNRSWVVRDFRV